MNSEEQLEPLKPGELENKLYEFAALREDGSVEAVYDEYNDLKVLCNYGLPDGPGIEDRRVLNFLDDSYHGKFYQDTELYVVK